MPCTPIRISDGTTGIACSRGQRTKRCTGCGSPSVALCDYALTGKAKGKTCDRAVCARCRVVQGPDRDYCRPHAEMAKRVGSGSLDVFTARISYRDEDAFNITRKSGGPGGEPFAPSLSILRPMLDARLTSIRMRVAGASDDADQLEDDAWRSYQRLYLEEMRDSYRAHRSAWDELLRRRRVVLVCYCVDAAQCHRTLLAAILSKLGARAGGEIAAERVPRTDASTADALRLPGLDDLPP